MEYYPATEKKELSSHEKTWRKYKHILLNERAQSEKATYYIRFQSYFGKEKLQRQQKDRWLPGFEETQGEMNRWSTWDSRAVTLFCVKL